MQQAHEQQPTTVYSACCTVLFVQYSASYASAAISPAGALSSCRALSALPAALPLLPLSCPPTCPATSLGTSLTLMPFLGPMVMPVDTCSVAWAAARQAGDVRQQLAEQGLGKTE